MANVEDIKDKAKGVVIDQIDRRTTDLGDMVGGHVENLRSMGDSLRTQGQESTARLVDVAADRLNRVSTYLTQTDGDRIVHDLESMARQQPLVTAAAGLVLGVTAARLLKAGATQRYQTYGTSGTSGTYGGSYGSYDRDYTENASTDVDYGVR